MNCRGCRIIPTHLGRSKEALFRRLPLSFYIRTFSIYQAKLVLIHNVYIFHVLSGDLRLNSN